MQDRYVGDVGDFGKYGLLRRLCRKDEYGAALSLGVLWYLFDGDDSANDGEHIDYLSANPSRHEKGLRDCDTQLFDLMRDLVTNRARSVADVEARGVLPPGTVFFAEGLEFDRTPANERPSKRENWLYRGLARVREAEVVFFDPDNGLEVPSRRRHSLKGPKHVYYDDLLPCWQRGQSLVVYHHLGRTYKGRSADAREQIEGRRRELCGLLPGARPIALRYRRRSSRVYFVLPNSSHASLLELRIKAFLESRWGREGNPSHFALVK